MNLSLFENVSSTIKMHQNLLSQTPMNGYLECF